MNFSFKNKSKNISILLSLSIFILFLSNIFFGSVSIPIQETWNILMGKADADCPWRYIIIESRLPQALTALLAGAGLAISGLMLQTAFDNPLAGPSILGITSGASLGVAIVMMSMGGMVTAGTLTIGGYMATILSAFIGSIFIMGLLLLFSNILKNNLLLLITGIMLGYITTSVISLLNYTTTEQGLQSYTLWGLGNFNGVSWEQMPFFCITMVLGIGIALSLIKPLNALLLGNQYAENLGVNLKRVRNLLLFSTGLLCAIVTAFCGPISFIGLAVPHIARLMLHSNNHRSLMPITLLCGSAIALFCNLLCTLPKELVIPLNAVTPIIGAPVIIYVICSKRFRG